MEPRIPVTILGATGVVGQRFVRRLARHPHFAIRHLAASERNAGRPYRDACAWRLEGEPWAGLGDRPLAPCDPGAAAAPVVFSALDSAAAAEAEPAFARAGALVFSNAAAWRLDETVPLLLAEVNPDHLGILPAQRRRHGWSGAIVCNPNCTAGVLVMALAPLHAAFGVEEVLVTSMQAVSGAGYPGVAALDILGNVIPYIPDEEEKVERETPKLLGRGTPDRIEPADLRISALCHRVPVADGHTEAVSVRLKGGPDPAAAAAAWRAWFPRPQELRLPSAPPVPVVVHEAADRPQPRLDLSGDGMAVHVGRLRRCPLLGLKFSLLGHNAERGAAGASVLNAELARARGLLS